MPRFSRRLRFVACLAPWVWSSCDPHADNSSETHFVECETTAECASKGPQYVCIEGKCQIPADSGPQGSGGSPTSRDSGSDATATSDAAGGHAGAGGGTEPVSDAGANDARGGAL